MHRDRASGHRPIGGRRNRCAARRRRGATRRLRIYAQPLTNQLLDLAFQKESGLLCKRDLLLEFVVGLQERRIS